MDTCEINKYNETNNTYSGMTGCGFDSVGYIENLSKPYKAEQEKDNIYVYYKDSYMKKGFTLIELLAVIVILAFVALIATPMVMKTIEKSKKGGAERSADNYINEVDTAITTRKLETGVIVEDGEYKTNNDGDICLDSDCTDKLKIEMNGTKPKSNSTVKIEDGKTTTNGTIIKYDTYTVVYNINIKRLEAKKIVYRWSISSKGIGESLTSSDYTIGPTSLTHNYYLKHVLDEDNKIVESHVCTKINNKEVCLQGGSASYYGYDSNEENYTGSFKTLNDLYNEGLTCNFNENNSNCINGSINFGGDQNGIVYAYDDYGDCHVNNDGSSGCIGY